ATWSFGRYGDVVAWIAIAAVALVVLDAQHVPTTFFFDEWSFIFDRRNGGLDSWLSPHNGHLTLLPAVAYRIGFALFGMDQYHPYRLMGLLAHIGVASLIFTYVRRRQGKIIGVAAGALFLLLGSGWEVIYQPFTINFMGAAIFGLISWLAVDRATKRGDLVAAAAAGAALMCSGLGIAMLIGTAARLSAQSDWRRLIHVVVPPGALYAVWYLAYGQSQGSRDNLRLLPRYFVDEAASSVGGLAGRDLLWGRLALGVLVGIVVMLLVLKRVTNLAVIAPATAMIVNWMLVGYSRADLGFPTSSRYVYSGAMFVILVAADIVPRSLQRRTSYLVAGAALIGIWGNWAVLHDGPTGMRRATVFARVELRAIEWASASVDPAYAPDPVRMPIVTAGQYLAAAADLGSAAASDAEVAANPDEFRREVDRVSLEAGGFGLVPASGDCAVSSTMVDGVEVAPAMVASGGSVAVTAGDNAVEVRLRRYADTFPEAPTAVIEPGSTMTIAVPADTAPKQEWTIDVRSISPIGVCPVV
ncbi:MAG: hypothetical protein ABIR32_00005, partial [Ilumatobacteraceae bacterium]